MNIQTSNQETFGFIVMGIDEILFATVQDNHLDILHRFKFQIPSKFSRPFCNTPPQLKKMYYLGKTAEMAKSFFIDPTTDQPKVAGIFVSSSFTFRSEVSALHLYHPQFKNLILKIVEIEYGGDLGLDTTIEKCSDMLSGVSFIEGKKLLKRFLKEIGSAGEKIVFDLEHTVKMLRLGVVKTLIVWEGLQTQCFILKSRTEEFPVKPFHWIMETELLPDGFEVYQTLSLVELLKVQYGFLLKLVSNMTKEGAQFCRTFEGIGAFLHIKNLIEDEELSY